MGKIRQKWRELSRYRQVFNGRIMWVQFLDKVLTKLAKLPLPFVRPLVHHGFLAKHRAILTYLERDFQDFLENYDFTGPASESKTTPRQIFSLWLQGREAAPPLVQAKHASQEAFAVQKGFNWTFLTQDNLSDYFQVPDSLRMFVDQGDIDVVKLSDLIRCSLLADYGGVWFDSTLYVTDTSSASYLANDFYTIPARGKEWYPKYVANNRWAMFCLAGSANHVIFRFLRDFQVEYLTRYRLPFDYFVIDYLLDIGYRYSDVIREAIDAVPQNNQDLYFIANHANDFVDVSEWDRVKSKTQLYKCSYKISLTATGDTYYHRLLNQAL